MLRIENLHVSVGSKEILKGVDLNIEKGEKVFILGPNGSGKSTLALSIMGYPKYRITEGKIYFEDEDITYLPVNERVKRGIFICMQNPIEVEGVSLRSLVQLGLRNLGRLNIETFEEEIKKYSQELGLSEEFSFRDLNVNLSGGERKKSEILQLSMFKPKLVILDEFDTGLDVDSLRMASNEINSLYSKDTSFLIITHYTRILKYIEPTKVKVMNNGKIVVEGGKDLVEKIEREGYSSII